jgi:hypothetical protein
MAGQYLARQELAEKRRGEVARAEALRDAAGRGCATPTVVARLRQTVGTGIARAKARMGGSRRAAPSASTAAHRGMPP